MLEEKPRSRYWGDPHVPLDLDEEDSGALFDTDFHHKPVDLAVIACRGCLILQILRRWAT